MDRNGEAGGSEDRGVAGGFWSNFHLARRERSCYRLPPEPMARPHLLERFSPVADMALIPRRNDFLGSRLTRALTNH